MTSYNVVALDVECGNNLRDSVYQVGWAKWDGEREEFGKTYVKTPYQESELYYFRGNWANIDGARPFSIVFTEILKPLLDEADYVVAHNAQFDRSALNASCRSAGLNLTESDWINTVLLSRKLFQVKHVKLSSVARRLGLQETHTAHDAESDARIAMRILQKGVDQYGWASVKTMVSGIRLDQIANAPEPQALPPRSSAEAVRVGSVTNERRVWGAVADTYDRELLIETASLKAEQALRLTRDELIDEWAKGYDARLPAMLEDQLREDLQSACRALGLDDAGYSKKLIARLLAFAGGEVNDRAETAIKNNTDNTHTLRYAIAEQVTRLDLVDFVSSMPNPPSRYYALPRDYLQRIFVEKWDGDLEQLLTSFSANLLKSVYSELGQEHPRLRSEMIDDLLSRYG